MSELVKAVKNEKYAEAEQLILNGADPNEVDEDSDDDEHTVLWWTVNKATDQNTATSSNANLVKLLISKGADPNKPNIQPNHPQSSKYPLLLALSTYYYRLQDPEVIKIVKILLDAGANPNLIPTREDGFFPPLIAAVDYNNIELVEIRSRS